MTDLEEAQKIAQELAQKTQETAHASIAAVVSKCLSSVFDNPYEFRVVFEQKRGKTDARLAFFRSENEVHPKDGAGHGVVDVAAVGLRVGEVLLARPQVAPVLILDEPFRNLSSPVFRERTKDMLERIAKEFKLQIILVTQTEELPAGRVVRFS